MKSNRSKYLFSYRMPIALLLLFASSIAGAQILPLEGEKLHYRLIGFSDPAVPKVKKYLLDIALCSCNTEDSFNKNIVISQSGSNDSMIAEVPYFGSKYTWRITAVHSSSAKPKGELHHFATNYIPDIDSSNTRLRIEKNSSRYKEALFFLDGNRALYNSKGYPIWYLPTIDHLNNEALRDVRDMKITSRGTITFLLNNIPYEINYHGDILWNAPNNGLVSGDSTEHYHHEFTRLNNGHYMVLGSEYVLWKLPSLAKPSLLLDGKTIHDSVSNTYYQKVEFGTIIEYNEKGDVIWSWKSSRYFRQSDLQNSINALNKFKDVHENSFYYNEKDQTIVISFRNISRILEIRYPGGEVIHTYGKEFGPGVTDLNNDLFCNQHSCKVSTDGNLYFFNNNCCHKQASPTIIMMQQPVTGKNELQKIWEYSCPVNDASARSHTQFTSGGNVTELSGHDMFVSYANDLSSNMFIISADKQVIWSGFPEKWNLIENKWDPVYQYRTSMIISRNEIEQMVWHKY